MKALIVYESAWGSTRFVSDEIGDGLAGHGARVEVVPAHEAPRLADLPVDLLVVGAHCRGADLPSGVRDWLDAIGPTPLAVATFDTHVRQNGPPSQAGANVARRLGELGCRLVADPESFHVGGPEGPLLPGELDQARAWGPRPDPWRRRLTGHHRRLPIPRGVCDPG